MILELKPDLKVAGLSRGAAVWRLLCLVLEEPFDVLGLVASRFRGKSKNVLHKIWSKIITKSWSKGLPGL